MTPALKSLLTAVALAAAGAASAASVTVPADTVTNYNGANYTFSGSGTLFFSNGCAGNGYSAACAGVTPGTADYYDSNKDLMGALYTGQVKLAGYGKANGQIAADYSVGSAAAPITSLTLDNATGSVQSALTTGGATMTTGNVKGISTGGTLTVTDLNVDLVNKKVYGVIIGANGVGTVKMDGSSGTNYLWDVAAITGATAVPASGSIAGTYTTNLTGLVVTSNAFNLFSQALGLQATGKAALQSVADFGQITSKITATASGSTPAVPEPSTYALMGLGLVGLAFAARRRAQ